MDYNGFAFTRESPWGQCLNHFLQSRRSPATVQGYSYVLERFFSMPPAKSPDQYSRADIETFIHAAWQSVAHGAHPIVPTRATADFRLSVLSSFYVFAATYTIDDPGGVPQPILRVPAPTTGMKRGKPSRAHRTLSEAEIKRFFAVIPDTVKGKRDRALCWMYFTTLRRLRELARLTWGDLEHGVVRDYDGTVREAWVYRYTGKGGKVRTAELSPYSKQLLDDYLVASERMDSMYPESPLFLGRTYHALSPSQINRMMKEYAIAAGLDKPVSAHVWRHSGAQQRFLMGQDILALKALLDHESLAVTDTYLRSLTSSADSAVQQLEARYWTER